MVSRSPRGAPPAPSTRALLGLVCAVLVGFSPGRGEAAAGTSVPVELRLVARPLPPSLDEQQVSQAIAEAARVWSYPAIDCTSLYLRLGPTSKARLAARDGENLIVFRTRSWCHNERCGGVRTYPFAAAAMTTPHSQDPVIEGDIELNGVSYDWGGETSVARRRADLHLVLAHELGHVLGLPDACGGGHRDPVPRDDCSERDSIMFAPALLERPSQLDVARICERYPRHARPAESDERPPRTYATLAGAAALALAMMAWHLLSVSRRASL